MTNLVSVAEAVALVRPVDSIGFGLGPANPDTFLTALGARDDWQDLQVGGALCLNYYEVFTKPGVRIPLRVLGPAERLLHDGGYQVELVPGGLPPVRADPGPVRPAGHGGPGARPDDAGNVNLSLHSGGPETNCSGRGATPSGC